MSLSAATFEVGNTESGQRYEVNIKPFAEGGSSYVYFAKCNDNLYCKIEPVAVKIFKPLINPEAFMHYEVGVLRALAKPVSKCEGSCLARELVSDPNLQECPYIIKVLDSFASDVGQIIVFPYYKNVLSEIIPELGFSISQVRTLLVQVCRALSYLRQKGVIHGDIKPANILIDDGGVIKLADFGLVQPNLHGSCIPPETQALMFPLGEFQSRDVVQTLPYRAPEILLHEILSELDFHSLSINSKERLILHGQESSSDVGYLALRAMFLDQLSLKGSTLESKKSALLALSLAGNSHEVDMWAAAMTAIEFFIGKVYISHSTSLSCLNALLEGFYYESLVFDCDVLLANLEAITNQKQGCDKLIKQLALMLALEPRFRANVDFQLDRLTNDIYWV